MKLNLGCGNHHLDGWVNVDVVADCKPDQIWNLEQFPWPWETNTVEEVLMRHVLEHLGQQPDTYLSIIKELYRVCRGGAQVTIIVPHPRHDDFLMDPTHVRPITPDGLDMFSQEQNLNGMCAGTANTPLGVYTGVDFSVRTVDLLWAEPWASKIENNKSRAKEAYAESQRLNNVIRQFTIVMEAIKPSALQREAFSR